MAGWDTLPPVQRASDSEREQVIRALRDGSVDGRLSHDTFVRRMDLALRARNSTELAGLRDLPPAGRFTQALIRTVGWWSLLCARLHHAWRAPRMPVLILPRSDVDVFTIGRAADCDLSLRDITVSWRHAELRRAGEGWVLADLGSTNGTRANGWRAGQGFTVRAGDWVTFGRSGFPWTRVRRRPGRVALAAAAA